MSLAHVPKPTAANISLVRDRLTILSEAISAVAESQSIDPFDLRLRVGLHLPLLHHRGQWTNAVAEKRLLHSLAVDIAKGRSHCKTLLAPSNRTFSATELSLEKLDAAGVESIARPIQEHLHYIHSFRDESEHFVVRTPDGRTCALLVISPCDLPHLLAPLQAASGVPLASQHIRVLSRGYAFRWAPANWASHSLSLLIQQLRKSDDVIQALITYLNPNLGFTGTSYVASNWSTIAHEQQEALTYLNGIYRTRRQLTMFPPRRSQKLEIAHMPLLPLSVFAVGWDAAIQIKQFRDPPPTVRIFDSAGS